MSNREPIAWITVNGKHIPIFEGETKQQTIDKYLKNEKRANNDEDRKQRQIKENKKEADDKNKKNDIQDSDIVKQAQSMVANKEYSKLGTFLSNHRQEFGLRKNEDVYMAAYDIIEGKRTLVKTKSESTKKVTTEKKEDKQKVDVTKNNSKFGPSDDDVIDSKTYFNNTSVQVNQSLAKWTEEADETGIPRIVSHYMEDSSINERLRSGGLNEQDMRTVNQLDKFVNSGKIEKGAIIYSGLTSEDAVQLFDKPDGEVINMKAFTSTSPDPIYARGYALNTDVVLQITATKTTAIGKTYFEDSTTTEGILGRNTNYKIVGRTTETINGERVKIIKVQI